MKCRIAMASSNGAEVDLHFGHANEFQIYEIDGEVHYFVESRYTRPCCQHQSHSTSRFDKVIELLSDCEAIFVSQIGGGAADYLISKGVRVFEAPYRIDEVIQITLEQGLLETRKQS